MCAVCPCCCPSPNHVGGVLLTYCHLLSLCSAAPPGLWKIFVRSAAAWPKHLGIPDNERQWRLASCFACARRSRASAVEGFRVARSLAATSGDCSASPSGCDPWCRWFASSCLTWLGVTFTGASSRAGVPSTRRTSFQCLSAATSIFREEKKQADGRPGSACEFSSRQASHLPALSGCSPAGLCSLWFALWRSEASRQHQGIAPECAPQSKWEETSLAASIRATPSEEPEPGESVFTFQIGQRIRANAYALTGQHEVASCMGPGDAVLSSWDLDMCYVPVWASLMLRGIGQCLSLRLNQAQWSLGFGKPQSCQGGPARSPLDKQAQMGVLSSGEFSSSFDPSPSG